MVGKRGQAERGEVRAAVTQGGERGPESRPEVGRDAGCGAASFAPPARARPPTRPAPGSRAGRAPRGRVAQRGGKF